MPRRPVPPVLANAPGFVLSLSAFEGSALPVSLFCEDGTLEWCNAAAHAIFGGPSVPREEAFGVNLALLRPDAFFFIERARLMRQLASANSSGVFRDVWNGVQFITHLHILPPVPGKPCRLFLCMHELASGPRGPEHFADQHFFDPSHQDLGTLSGLSERELEVLALVGQCQPAAEIARALHRSVDTVNSHKAALFRKLGCANAIELGILAQRAGLKLSDAARFAHPD